jgi:sugar phosphate isomerase/epimerase
MQRRTFLALAAAPAGPAGSWPARLAVMCQLGSTEANARRVLEAAAQAGYQRIQINFAWDKVDQAFLQNLPGWISSAGLHCDTLGAYVNCLAPEVNLMATRASDFLRAIELAPALGAHTLVAWTGSHLPDLMKPDPRNPTAASEDAILKFIEQHLARLQQAKLTLALETYITLACPDAPSLRRLLDRLPPSVGAVLDPPNLTPIARYKDRDQAMREMVKTLGPRIAVVHLKDFKLRPDGQSYDLPGPLGGEMNYPLYLNLVRGLPARIPVVAEHIGPAEFASTRQRLLAL